MAVSVNGKKSAADTSLFVACINLRWPETGDQEEAIKYVLEHPKIKRKISYEINRLTDQNLEIDKDELRRDIETLLYMAIKKEFNLSLDPQKMAGWLCARIAWRTMDHIAKECDLVYDLDPETGSNKYRRIDKVSLDHVIDEQAVSSADALVGDMISAEIERHKTFEGFLRKSRIKTGHKHVLMYIIAMNYDFRELADIYGVSSPTARKLYRNAVSALKKYVMGLTHEEQESVRKLLGGVCENA